MIVYRNYAIGLVKKGTAEILGTCTPDGEMGQRYAILNNLEEQRTDHFALRDGEYFDDDKKDLILQTGASVAAATLGRKGGLAKSAAKAITSPENGTKGGRPTYSAAAARDIERENKRFAALPSAASGEGMARYAEEHARIIEAIVAKYGCRREVTKVLPNGIKCVTIYDKQGGIVAEHHE